MSEKKSNRDRWVHLRLTAIEYNKINTGFKNSTKRKLSQYIRAVLLKNPVTVYTRNQSFDDYVSAMILLKTELKAIGNNFNQSVKKLHSLHHDEEIKLWARNHEKNHEEFLKKMEEINHQINQISDKWLQE
ncbi:MAG: hypothetical protein ABIN01_05930 [Ferruginibacter sp.]